MDEPNPWLLPRNADTITKAPRKNNEVVVSKDSSAITKSKNKLKKQAKKREEERAKAKDDATMEISMENVLTLEATPIASSSLPKKSAQEKPIGNTVNGVPADESDDNNSEVEAQEKALNFKGKGKAKGLKAFEQRDLVALAFAGDNVVQVEH